LKVRTVWISDLHLGTTACNAEGVLEFLKSVDCETLYVVGDFVDVWSLRRMPYWRQGFNDVIQKLLRRARKGTRVILIPGNHDAFALNLIGAYGNIRVVEQDIHQTADGRRLMVMHGHEFDGIIRHAPLLSMLGDLGYHLLIFLNRYLNRVREWFGKDYWSLSAYVKSKVKDAVKFVGSYEKAVVKYAHLHAADGIVNGHIHTPCIKPIGDIMYYNTGDWVESNSAIVEHHDGRMELIYWHEMVRTGGAVVEEDEADEA
jgi:UDP-2,3-diacylglucosamine pyrophosphatase LpxH